MGPRETSLLCELLTLKPETELSHWILELFVTLKMNLSLIFWHYVCTTKTTTASCRLQQQGGGHLRSSNPALSWKLWSFPRETVKLIPLGWSASEQVHTLVLDTVYLRRKCWNTLESMKVRQANCIHQQVLFSFFFFYDTRVELRVLCLLVLLIMISSPQCQPYFAVVIFWRGSCVSAWTSMDCDLLISTFHISGIIGVYHCAHFIG
jgi:hypothetical protein